ncbi:MAG: hypothetical protein KIT62_02465 [Cyclobacteriaceae bacterium]|nr:hypothetical protein [Cyclobacteriaceae bacterium]
MVIKISAKSKPEETKKALERMARAQKKHRKKLSDFYGKLPGLYGDGLEYQKKVRDEWS